MRNSYLTSAFAGTAFLVMLFGNDVRAIADDESYNEVKAATQDQIVVAMSLVSSKLCHFDLDLVKFSSLVKAAFPMDDAAYLRRMKALTSYMIFAWNNQNSTAAETAAACEQAKDVARSGGILK
jgi:hypothetical protein